MRSNFAFVFLLVGVLPRSAHATAVMACADSNGVVLSADSKITVVGNEKRSIEVNKLVPVGDHAVVAMTGVAVWSDLKYDFWSWLKHSTARLKHDPTPAEVAEALRRNAARTFAKHGTAFDKPGMATYFIVAGLDTDGISIWQVHIEPNGHDVRVSNERRFGPMERDARMFGWGFPASLAFDDTRGPLWVAIRERTPEWLARLVRSSELTVYQRAQVCGIPIAIAEEKAPFIGGPITQALVTRDTGVLVATWKPPPAQQPTP